MIEPIKKKLLSQAIGRIKVDESIDLQKMRDEVQKKAAEEIFSDEKGWSLPK